VTLTVIIVLTDLKTLYQSNKVLEPTSAVH
jgi:hypothetical protein